MNARASRIRQHLRPRRLHVYGIGNGKSGTSSLAEMFGAYRSAHEVDRVRMRSLAAAVLRGEVGPCSPRVRRVLRYRTWRFHLDVDVAGNMSAFAGCTARMYPDAKFVLLVRDCFTWLDSRIEHSLRYPGDAASEYVRARHPHIVDHAPEEAELAAAGIPPIAEYVAGWAATTKGVLRDVRADRLLVVRTEDLDSSVPALARFVGVPESTLQPAHANERKERTGLLSTVPRQFVIARAQEYCADVMERFWGPDWLDLAATLPATKR